MSVSFVKTKIPKLEEGDKLPEVPVNPTDKRFVSGTGTFDVEGAMGSLDANNPEHRRIQRRLSRIQSAGKAGGDIGVDRAENGTVKWRFQDAANDKGRQGGVADSERTGMGGKGFLGVSGAVYEQAYDYMVKNGFIKFSEKNLREEAAAPVKAEVAEVAGEKSPNEPVVETVVEGAAGGEKDVDVKPPARRDPPPPANPVSPAARTETPLYSAAAVQDNPTTSYADVFDTSQRDRHATTTSLLRPAQATAYGMSPAGASEQIWPAVQGQKNKWTQEHNWTDFANLVLGNNNDPNIVEMGMKGLDANNLLRQVTSFFGVESTEDEAFNKKMEVLYGKASSHSKASGIGFDDAIKDIVGDNMISRFVGSLFSNVGIPTSGAIGSRAAAATTSTAAPRAQQALGVPRVRPTTGPVSQGTGVHVTPQGAGAPVPKQIGSPNLQLPAPRPSARTPRLPEPQRSRVIRTEAPVQQGTTIRVAPTSVTVDPVANAMRYANTMVDDATKLARSVSSQTGAKAGKVKNFLEGQLGLFAKGGSLQVAEKGLKYKSSNIPSYGKGGKKILLKKPGSCGCSKS